MKNTIKELTSNKLIARNSLINISGQIIPIIVAIITIPIIIKGLGLERFGILTLAWALTGYFNLFDFGIGRAITKIVSEHLGGNKNYDISVMIGSGLTVITIMGCIGASLLYLFSPNLVSLIIKMPEPLVQETLVVMNILAITIPIVICSSYLRGILEAFQKFKYINYIRMPINISTYVGPAVLLEFSKNLTYFALILLILRVIELITYLIYSKKLVKLKWKHYLLNIYSIKELLKYGGWITITNILGPFVAYMDRFIIGSVVSINAVAYYATPSEIITRLMIIPSALSGVLFPAFSASLGNEMATAANIFERGLKYTIILIYPITITVYMFAEKFLEVWLGYQFSENSTEVLKLLTIGALINSLSYIPYALIQASGRPNFIAKQQFYTFPIFCMLIYILTNLYGVVGAAIAWTTRACIDFIILLYKSNQILNIKSTTKLIAFILPILIGLIILGSLLPIDTNGKILYVILQNIIFAIFFWFFIFRNDERIFFKKILFNKPNE
jgi:O-antigen/teichoic acid export membrane protein